MNFPIGWLLLRPELWVLGYRCPTRKRRPNSHVVFRDLPFPPHRSRQRMISNYLPLPYPATRTSPTGFPTFRVRQDLSRRQRNPRLLCRPCLLLVNNLRLRKVKHLTGGRALLRLPQLPQPPRQPRRSPTSPWQARTPLPWKCRIGFPVLHLPKRQRQRLRLPV